MTAFRAPSRYKPERATSSERLPQMEDIGHRTRKAAASMANL